MMPLVDIKLRALLSSASAFKCRVQEVLATSLALPLSVAAAGTSDSTRYGSVRPFRDMTGGSYFPWSVAERAGTQLTVSEPSTPTQTTKTNRKEKNVALSVCDLDRALPDPARHPHLLINSPLSNRRPTEQKKERKKRLERNNRRKTRWQALKARYPWVQEVPWEKEVTWSADFDTDIEDHLDLIERPADLLLREFAEAPGGGFHFSDRLVHSDQDLWRHA
eukprot:1271219-Rhodomonas_salina.1